MEDCIKTTDLRLCNLARQLTVNSKSKPCIVSGAITKAREGLNFIPETEKDCAGVLAHLVVWHNISKLPAHIAYMLQHWVALLAFVHKDSVRVDLYPSTC